MTKIPPTRRAASTLNVRNEFGRHNVAGEARGPAAAMDDGGTAMHGAIAETA
jgi:hypothetical protein